MAYWKPKHVAALGPKRAFMAALLAAQRGLCHYCGKRMSTKSRYLNRATLDHVIPRSRGGATTHDNLVLACFVCNSRKSNRLLNELAEPSES